MTEEEKLAKEYADKRIGKVLENSTFPNSYWHRQDWENCKQDFLAGLKVGKEEHEKLLKLPNWNNEVFKEITGIDTEAEITKE